MKHLKIDSGKGLYSPDGTTWKEIDLITRDELLVLVGLALQTDFELDEFEIDKVSNPAHQIVYKHISERLAELVENRSTFNDESEALFREAFAKYSLPDEVTN